MNHDVFISYSRKDKQQAEALCNALAAAGVKYWIDLSIGGSTNFLTEITRRIKACKTLIFIASANSAASEFTQKEILYAIKHKKPILPYKIGDFQFEDNDELDFIFTNVQWVESLDAVVSALKDMGLTNKTTSEVVVPKPEPQPKPQPKPATKTYKVGDLYDDGTKRGVVFEVTPDGRHGKIVSLEEGFECWTIIKNYIRFNVGMSYVDGMDNMKNVQGVDGWRDDYPAFAWCASLGDGWYLPAIEELMIFTVDNSVRKAVNRSLGYQKMKVIQGGDVTYLSSTHRCIEGNFAKVVHMQYGGDSSVAGVNRPFLVRAVAKF